MVELINAVLSWPTFMMALLVFGFLPGVVLRQAVRFYPRDDPRRRELVNELYVIPPISRPLWVATQLETAIHEGFSARWTKRRERSDRRSGDSSNSLERAERPDPLLQAPDFAWLVAKAKPTRSKPRSGTRIDLAYAIEATAALLFEMRPVRKDCDTLLRLAVAGNASPDDRRRYRIKRLYLLRLESSGRPISIEKEAAQVLAQRSELVIGVLRDLSEPFPEPQPSE